MADQRAQYNEQAVGANHPTLTDTVNRLTLVEHNTDGTHKPATKVTPVDADIVLGQDSASSFALIKSTWTSVKAFLKTYFDTIYSPKAGSSSIVTVGNITSGTWNGTIIANATNATHATNADLATNATNATNAATASLLNNPLVITTSGGTSPGTTFNGSVIRTIDYSTVGAAALAGSSSQAFATANLTVAGNLGFTGTGNRITGDMSNVTPSSRLAIQNSTVNGNTVPIFLPNGTSVVSGWRAYNASDPTNAGYISVGSGSTVHTLNTSVSGTGTQLPLGFSVAGVENIRLNTTGNVQIGAAGGVETSGAEKLQVTGSASISGSLVLGGTAVTATAGELNQLHSSTGTLQLPALDTAPASAGATGTLGEVRIAADSIYVCVATNTWLRAPLFAW